MYPSAKFFIQFLHQAFIAVFRSPTLLAFLKQVPQRSNFSFIIFEKSQGCSYYLTGGSVAPCQDGGVAAFIFEHGDSGCGDTNWPKSLLYVAGWGYGHAQLNGEKLYEDYEIHFMVTQGMRDRESLKVNYPLLNKKSPAGAVNPTMQQLDFFIRSPEMDERNSPGRKVFDHFFAMEMTWK